MLLGIGPKPMYRFGIYSAASTAKLLGLQGISVIEFGVAGGNGLLAMEKAADEVGKHFGVSIDVFGFDTGGGMPAPTDYRDLPYVWGEGFYAMDVERLQAKLKGARLILGNVEGTIPAFLEEIKYQIGFAAFDLDYYSSTKMAFRVWEGTPQTRLPRAICYFDDIIWPERAYYNEYTGELCAIREYNLEHAEMKLCPIHLLRHTLPHPSAWHDQMYVLHDFHHPLYCINITPKDASFTQSPL
ncbi:MAG: hypothetical protein WCA49_01995 [Candidatus Sulfotelmatobacter sp.]